MNLNKQIREKFDLYFQNWLLDPDRSGLDENSYNDFFFRPDPGCLQYHTGLTGRLTSFNFLPTNDNHLSNQKYVWKSVKFWSLNWVINFSWRPVFDSKIVMGQALPLHSYSSRIWATLVLAIEIVLLNRSYSTISEN